MSKVARATDPLFQTKGRPVFWSVTFRTPAGALVDLTGTTVTAALRYGGNDHALTISAPDATGRITLTGANTLTIALPMAPDAVDVLLTLIDTLGRVFDFIYPVVVEEL